jgi:hypothetical protein
MERDFGQRGFVVLKPSWVAKHLGDIQEELLNTIHGFPDFKAQNGVWGVRRDGILTNPGSFHNQLSRRLRQCATAEIGRIIIDLLNAHPTFGVQCVLAPLAISHTGHRPKDHARYKRKPFDPTKVVLVGYLNIGQTTQTFTCAPGTHVVRDASSDKPAEVFRQLHQVDAIPKATDCQDQNFCDGNAIKIRVPPGAMVVYHTTLLVKIETSRLATEASQHLKWVFSAREQNLSAVRDLAQPTNWAAYYPGDFSKSKHGLAVSRLEAYSQGFPKHWRVDTAYGSTLGEGEIKGGRIPPVIGHSLRELNPTYPEYNPPELNLYTNSRGPWQLGTLRDSFCVRVVLSIDGEQALSRPHKSPNSTKSLKSINEVGQSNLWLASLPTPTRLNKLNTAVGQNRKPSALVTTPRPKRTRPPASAVSFQFGTKPASKGGRDAEFDVKEEEEEDTEQAEEQVAERPERFLPDTEDEGEEDEEVIVKSQAKPSPPQTFLQDEDDEVEYLLTEDDENDEAPAKSAAYPSPPQTIPLDADDDGEYLLTEDEASDAPEAKQTIAYRPVARKARRREFNRR